VLTDAQLADARRFLGYQVAGTTMPITNDQDLVYITYGMTIMSLHTRLTSLSAVEEATTITYLGQLNTLEAAIVGAGDNLDTAQAAVWTRNKNEVSDRTSLFNQWRRALCGFLGVPPGPSLGNGGISISRA
jgi:hypothetical protein